MDNVFVLNKLRWYARWPIKTIVFLLVLLLVLFPYPNRLIRHVERLRNPAVLVDPEAPEVGPLTEELRPQLDGAESPADALKTVERYVYAKVPYAWDWETWGTADYLPTISEVVTMGKEDCDGRAVLAASLLQNLGYKAELVTDFGHVWVKTDKGETMGPGKKKAAVATKEGLKFQPGALSQMVRSTGYGIAVFPLARELVVLLVFWFLMLRPRGGRVCTFLSLVLLIDALLFIRIGARNPRNPVLWVQWIGVANFVIAVLLLIFWARRNARPAGAVREHSSRVGSNTASDSQNKDGSW
jgi:hypothetical protein